MRSSGQRHLRGRPEIVVGCPGRVLDLLQQGESCAWASVETLVLDEADHMFDMGFLPDMQEDPPGSVRSGARTCSSRRRCPREIRQPGGRSPAPAARGRTGRRVRPPPPSTTRWYAGVGGTQAGSARARPRPATTATRRSSSRAPSIAPGDWPSSSARPGDTEPSALQGNMSQGQRDRAMRGFRSRHATTSWWPPTSPLAASTSATSRT